MFFFFSLPAGVTWVENTNKTIPCVPSLQPQAATFPHSPLGPYRVSCFCPEGPSSSLCSHPHLKNSAQATSSRKHSKWPWAPSLTSVQLLHFPPAQPLPLSTECLLSPLLTLYVSGTGGVSYSSSEPPSIQRRARDRAHARGC